MGKSFGRVTKASKTGREKILIHMHSVAPALLSGRSLHRTIVRPDGN